MTVRGVRGLAAAIVVLATAVACAPKSPVETQPGPGRALAGLYRAELHGATGRARRFRMWLWAQAPDRLHGEVLTPVGTTALILDGGGGQLAVTIVREATTFVGTATPEDLERVFGLRLPIEDLVEALRGLPARQELVLGERRLALKRLRVEPLGVEHGALGTGRPPAGVEVRELAELGSRELPDETEPRR